MLTAQESYNPDSGVGSVLPKSDPGAYSALITIDLAELCEAYAFCAWPRAGNKRTVGELISTNRCGCTVDSPVTRSLYLFMSVELAHQAPNALLVRNVALVSPSKGSLATLVGNVVAAQD